MTEILNLVGMSRLAVINYNMARMLKGSKRSVINRAEFIRLGTQAEKLRGLMNRAGDMEEKRDKPDVL